MNGPVHTPGKTMSERERWQPAVHSAWHQINPHSLSGIFSWHEAVSGNWVFIRRVRV